MGNSLSRVISPRLECQFRRQWSGYRMKDRGQREMRGSTICDSPILYLIRVL